MANGAMNGTIALTRLSDRHLLQALQVHTKYVVRLCFSSDKKMLASCSYDKSIIIHHYTADGQWQVLQRHTLAKNPEAILFTPDDSHLIFTQRDDCFVHYLPMSNTLPHGSAPKILSFNFNETQDEHVSFSVVDIRTFSLNKRPQTAKQRSRFDSVFILQSDILPGHPSSRCRRTRTSRKSS